MENSSPEKAKELKIEISQIKRRLDSISSNRENWFKRKEDLKKDINLNVRQIKEIKAAKDKSNIELEELKKQRDRYNAEVKNLIKKIKSLNKEKDIAFKKYNIKVDPSKIQEKINELEKRVETEVNFEKEKKLMEEIKKLKKSYEEGAEVLKISENAASIDNEIKSTRKKANEFHKKILEITKDTNYKVFIDLSKKINELKLEQEAAFQKFIDHKKDYGEAGKELRIKLEQLNTLIPPKEVVFKNQKRDSKQSIKQTTEAYVKRKFRQVQEKLRGNKKLTTEDILAIQGASS